MTALQLIKQDNCFFALCNNTIAVSIALLTLCVAGISFHCATTTTQGTISIPCKNAKDNVLREARQYLARTGFEQKVFLPDSGYFRTTALQAGSVATTPLGRQSWYVFELFYHAQTLDIRAYQLIPRRNSESLKNQTTPEDESGTEEEPVLPGERFYMMVVEPFIDHMLKNCR